MYRPLVTLLALAALATAATVATAESDPVDGNREMAALRDAYLARFKPLWLESSAAWWEANTTGSDAAFARKKAADQALVKLHSNPETFARLKSIKAAGTVTDPALKRQLEVMYNTFLPGQADNDLQLRIVEIENDVEQTFNTHRSEVAGKTLTENEVREILLKTTDSAAAEQAWKGYMRVGAKVEDRLHELVKLRNQTARQLGFKNYYALRLQMQEIDEREFFNLFDELDRLTREPFAEIKADIDKAMAQRFNIPVSELRPWHFGDLFFQEAPAGDEVDLDGVFKGVDLVDLVSRYYASIGLPCDHIIARSDLYEKPGKSPHAFCADLDRIGDIRVLCNLKSNLYWADTLMHEVGHAVYDNAIRRDLPFLLHEASHSITTEGIAMMFGAMVKSGDWLVNVRKLDPAQAAPVVAAARKALRTEKIIFSRWTQVMVRFEHEMYTNPDQNLGRLWWDLKKRYQLLPPPDDQGAVDRPDYAAKVHILTAPVYYHSYLMGDLFAAQVQHYIAENVLHRRDKTNTSFYGETRAGDYLREKVFGPGNLYSWNELTRRATGEPLTAKYFAQKFVH